LSREFKIKLTKEEKNVIICLCFLLVTISIVSHLSSKVFCKNETSSISLKETITKLEKDSRIKINEATIFELTQISGIGKSLAGRIVEYRKGYGTFSNFESLLRVKGIGPKKLDKIKRYIKL